MAHFFYFLLFSIRPPLGLLPVLGPLTRYMTPTLDAALLMCGSPERGRATSSRAGADLGHKWRLVWTLSYAYPLSHHGWIKWYTLWMVKFKMVRLCVKPNHSQTVISHDTYNISTVGFKYQTSLVDKWSKEYVSLFWQGRSSVFQWS